MPFSKFNPRSSMQFDLPNMEWGQEMFEFWRQSMGSSDALLKIQSAAQKMFETIEQTVQQNWASHPSMKKAEEATRQNKTLFPNGCDPAYAQTMIEINKIAMAMVQSIMQLQQQYLSQLFQKVGQGMTQNSKGRSTFNQQDYDRGEDLSNQTAKYFATMFSIMKQANQEIYQKFTHMNPESEFNEKENNFSSKEDASNVQEKESGEKFETSKEKPRESEKVNPQRKTQAPKTSKKKRLPHED